MSKTDEETVDLSCRRCGTCCKKGGPALHLEDSSLIEEGTIGLKNIYSLRAGEPVSDNVNGGVFYLQEDIVKIKGRDNSSCCIYFDATDNGCMIYRNRPVECRVLNCRDTAKIKEIYSKNRLTRKDLVGGVEGLWDLVKDHQKKCSYKEIRDLCDKLKGCSHERDQEALLEIIKYDLHLRGVMEEKSSIDPMIMDFLFGKPLTETLGGFGISVLRVDDRLIIRPV